MRPEAVVAEAERKQIGGSAEGGVGAASIGGGNQKCPLSGSLREDLIQFVGLNQRNIGGHDQRAVTAAHHAEARGHLDSAGFAGVRGVGNDFEIVLPRQFNRERVAGDKGAGRAARPRCKCGYNVCLLYTSRCV